MYGYSDITGESGNLVGCSIWFSTTAFIDYVSPFTGIFIYSYGLLGTFLKGPGAPPWAGSAPEDNVIRLTVPEGITTIGIDEDKIDPVAVLQNAQSEAEIELQNLSF